MLTRGQRKNMACSAPITIKTKAGNVEVRCKQCLPCRINRQSSISLKALLENATSVSSDFWTLTYADAPEELDYNDFSKFLKRYRHWNREEGNRLSIRYLSVGEYGSKSGRAHFHALIFNGLSPDRATCRTRLWPHGFAYIGTVTPASIRYTARYCLKFAEKGKEGTANWSLRPSLGDDGMRQIARYHRDNQIQRLKEPPSAMRIEGRNYAVDPTLQKIFWDEYTRGCEVKRSKPIKAHLEYVLKRRFGDPIEAQRRRDLARHEFFESARFTNERI